MGNLIVKYQKLLSILYSVFSRKNTAIFDLDSLSVPAFLSSKEDGTIIQSNIYFKELFSSIIHENHFNLAELLHQVPEEFITEVFNSDIYTGYVINYPKQKNTKLNELFHFCFDVSPIPKLLIDIEGKVIRSNQAFITMINNKKYSNLDWLFYKMANNDQQDFLKENFNNVLNESIIKKPLEIQLKGSKNLYSLVFITKLKHPLLAGMFVIDLIDITEHKNLEISFAHSQKMQALGQLAGGIAHDFNNLLTAMLGFSDLLLLRHPAGDPSFTEIIQIKQNINRAISLVRQLLSFSKKQILNVQIIDTNEVLAELSQLISRLIDERIKLETKCEPNLGSIKIDHSQLEQVIINLVVNARDSMSYGGTLTITAKNITVDDNNRFYKNMITPCVHGHIENDDYVLITIADTGKGIPKNITQKIFEPFFSTKNTESNTGLGLATVYGIIKQTGGYLFLETQEKVGSKFHILLKAYKNNLENKITAEGANGTLNNQDKIVDLSGSSKILIVEDEEAVRTVSTHALNNRGYKILEAANGIEAFDLIKKHEGQIDLIISDVMMPHINGPEMIKEVHKLYPNIKVLFISGYTEHAVLDEISNNSKVHFLAKPFTLKELAIKVKEVLML